MEIIDQNTYESGAFRSLSNEIDNKTWLSFIKIHVKICIVYNV